MKYMTSNEIRNTWLRFFKNHNHHVLESSSLVPVNDQHYFGLMLVLPH